MSLTTALTYALPHRLLSSMARSLAYSDDPRVSRWLIDTVTRKFNVNLDEAANPDPRSYATFNQFFTRALKPGARVADADPRSLVMPADGRISQLGKIEAALRAEGFTAWEEIELDDGVWEVDDAVSGDGLKYDVVLDQSFAVIAREEDGRDLSRKAP